MPASPMHAGAVPVSPLKRGARNTPKVKGTASSKAPVAAAAAASVSWHALSTEQVFQLLESDAGLGLTDEEALHRQKTIFGRNVMTPGKKLSFLARVWEQINNILIWILLGSAVVSIVLGKTAEVALILLVVTVNVAIGLVQEGKAEKAAEALKALLSPQCTVVRAGARNVIDAAELVPGDVIFLQSGDRIPADVRLFDVTKLQVLEALLTGESHPVPKHTQPTPPLAPLGDRKCMGFGATLIMSGQALGVVVETGDFSEIGRINALVSGTESGRTNLTVQLEIFGRWISGIVAVIAIATLLLAHLYKGESLGVAFTSAVAVAVAIIPEGLPAVVTIVLAIGTQAMARQHAIIKSLPAVETLGSVTVICSDKTGTLTKNEMTAVSVRTASGAYPVSGVGYAPVGTVNREDGSPVDEVSLAKLRSLLLAGILCSDADVREPAAVSVAIPAGAGGASPSATPPSSPSPSTSGGAPPSTLWTPVGDPTEVALVTLSRKAGVHDTRGTRLRHPRVATIPFESEYKFMATAHAVTHDTLPDFPGMAVGQRAIFVKGAPDRLIPRCTMQVVGDDGSARVSMDEAFWLAQAAALSTKGLRVLALCRAAMPEGLAASELSAAHVTDGDIPLTMLGLVAILDPPREEAVTAIAEAHTAGIVVKMITGDHRDTALAIGAMLAISPPGHTAYTGTEIDAMSDPQLESIVMTCNVFARASPENKIRIVKALQKLGQVCSMTGDGVNDAPALKAANIGVAMGITGTDVSKEAAKMVLADDNFATIVAAVREGRRVWDNLVKILTYNTPVNIAQGMTTFFAYALALDNPPLTAIATLYVNMVTSVAMGMAFAFEPQEADIMTRPPRAPGTRLFSTDVLWRNFFVGFLIILAILIGFELSLLEGLTLQQRRGEAFTTLIFCEIAYVFNCRFLRSSSLTLDVFRGNPWIFLSIFMTAAMQVLIIYVPGLNTFFNVDAIPATSWGRLLGLSAAVFFIVEVEKKVVHLLRPTLERVFTAVSRVTPAVLAMPAHVEAVSTAKEADDGGGSGADVAVVGGAPRTPTLTPAPTPAFGAAHHPAELTQAELDSVRFIATSASSFGIPVHAGVPGKPGQAGGRVGARALSTADMFTAAAATSAASNAASRTGTPALAPIPEDAGAGMPSLTLTAVAAQFAVSDKAGGGGHVLPHGDAGLVIRQHHDDAPA